MSEAVLPAPTIISLPFRPIGGQVPFARADLDRFLSETRIATLSYVRKSGQSNQTPLWYEYINGLMQFVASTGSAKHSALQRDPRVCVAVHDDQPPYRAVIIDGTVELIDLGTAGNISRETLLRLAPTDVKGFDNTQSANHSLLRNL